MLSAFKKRKLQKLVKQALSDDVLTEDEFAEIERYREEAGLSSDIVGQVRQKHAHQLLRPIMKRVERSRRLSPEQEREIEEKLTRVGMVPPRNAQLMMYKKLWELENLGHFNPEPIPAAGIVLKRGEECFHRVRTVWARMKTITERHGYRSAGVSIRVAKGVSFRLGQTKPVTTKYEAMTDIDDGTLFVTNKRLMFAGSHKSTAITYGRVVSFEVFTDAFVIFKTSGPVEYFRVSQADAEYLGAVVDAVS